MADRPPEEFAAPSVRLRHLFELSQKVTDELDLPVLLRRIVESAAELIGARYAAMGVLDEKGVGLAQFIHVGISDEDAARIGHLPEGRGLLGALIEAPHPVRIEAIYADPRSSGFPAHHPPMSSFLGVPVHVRGSIFGNLYLTESLSGAFTEDDQLLAEALAALAAIAIKDSRLVEGAEFRARWLHRISEKVRAFTEDHDPLHYFLADAAELGAAKAAFVIRQAEEEHQVVAFHGVEPEDTESLRELVDHALHHGTEFTTSRDSHSDTVLMSPFRGHDGVGHVVVLVRDHDDPFSELDLELVEAVGRNIAAAIDRDEARHNHQRMALLEDRTRIARDLHDLVIQRLYGAGLSLQATASTLSGDQAERITTQIKELDATIAQIRQSIFALEQSRPSASLRARVLEAADRAAPHLQQRPRIVFTGPVDLMAGSLTDDIVAVVGEALANVIRHAEATTAEVDVRVDQGAVSVTVTDDGVGVTETPRLSGLLNLRDRAEDLGGAFVLAPVPTGGTRMTWSAPV